MKLSKMQSNQIHTLPQLLSTYQLEISRELTDSSTEDSCTILIGNKKLIKKR